MVEPQEINKVTNKFPSIPAVNVDVPERDRSYQRDNIIQQTLVDGDNRDIIMKDEDGVEQLFIGKEDA